MSILFSQTRYNRRVEFAVEIAGNRIALSPGLFRIGRDPLCEIRLKAESISRRHASLRVETSRVLLLDHGSRNGVRVNGVRVYGEVEITPGDRIEIGTEALVLLRPGMRDTGIPAATKPLPRIPETKTSPLDALSKREREVFERLALGETQREIAEALGLSVKTVETYKSRITEKLAIRTRADLVRLALDVGVLK
jgi:pSer/pThr/pTyr-binding forkhead associated (FHA) protein